MGLLDNFGFDPNDPRKAAMMAAAAQLMMGRGNLGQSMGQGLLAGMGAYQNAGLMGDRKAQEAQEREFRKRQMDAYDRQQANETGLSQAARTAFMQPNQNLVANDDMGNAMPQVPGGGGMPEFMRLGAPYMNASQIASFAQKQDQPMILAEGARAFGRDGREIASNPKSMKPEGPRKGQIREIKSGNRILTYEFDGAEWKKIGDSAQFKPDGPEKPKDPPAGYRWNNGNLEFIPGGPADPASGRKTAVPTEDERRSAGLAVRMENAIQTMGKFPDAGKPEIAAEITRNIPILPGREAIANKITSGERQQVEAAQLDALDAALTLATGAAYTKDQLRNLSKSYFPQIGDDPNTVKAKEANLRKVIETARIRAGRSAGDIDRVNGGPNVDDLLKKYLGR